MCWGLQYLVVLAPPSSNKKKGSEINVVFFGRQDSQLWSYGWSGDRATLRYCGSIEQNMFHDHMFNALDRIANLWDPSKKMLYCLGWNMLESSDFFIKNWVRLGLVVGRLLDHCSSNYIHGRKPCFEQVLFCEGKLRPVAIVACCCGPMVVA